MMLAAYGALAPGRTSLYRHAEQIRGSYQYFTQSEVDAPARAGSMAAYGAGRCGRHLREGFLDRADRFR